MAPEFDAGVERCFALAVIDVEKIGQDAREHLPGTGCGKMPVLQLLVLTTEDFLAVAARQHTPLVEGIEKLYQIYKKRQGERKKTCF